MYRWEHEQLIDEYSTKMATPEAKAIKENDLSKIREEIAADILAFGVNLASLLKI